MSSEQELVQQAVEAFLEHYEAEREEDAVEAKRDGRKPGIPAYAGQPNVLSSRLTPNAEAPTGAVVVLESGHKFAYTAPDDSGETQKPVKARGRGKSDPLSEAVSKG